MEATEAAAAAEEAAAVSFFALDIGESISRGRAVEFVAAGDGGKEPLPR